MIRGKRGLGWIVVLTGILTMLPMVRAHDMVSPDWRFRPGSTYQEWCFDDASNPAEPEVIYNPYGGAETEVVLGQFNSGWHYQLPGFGTQQGFWDTGGAGANLIVTIDDHPLPVATRDIQVQVTFFLDISQAPTVSVAGATLIEEERHLVERVTTGGNWYADRSVWRLSPVTADDEIVITPNQTWGSVIDQVVVDTFSPGTCPDPFADADADGDVDQVDFGIWQGCFSGPGGGVQAGCECFDRDGGVGDGDVDEADFQAFAACRSGPGIPADPACDD